MKEQLGEAPRTFSRGLGQNGFAVRRLRSVTVIYNYRFRYTFGLPGKSAVSVRWIFEDSDVFRCVRNGVFSDPTRIVIGAIGAINMVKGNLTLRFGGECPRVFTSCETTYRGQRFAVNGLVL